MPPILWLVRLLIGGSRRTPRRATTEELQRLVVATGLPWRKGSVFEKTEIKPRRQ